MKKNYVLDTNVVLHDPNALSRFDDNNVVLPIGVIEELDEFKKGANSLGHHARAASKFIDSLRGDGRSLEDGCPLPSGGTLRVIFNDKMDCLPKPLHGDKVDNHILAVCLYLKTHDKETPTVLVSKDTNMRIKSDSLGIPSQDYRNDKVRNVDDLFSGSTEIEVEQRLIDALYDSGQITLPYLAAQGLHPNQYLVLATAGSQKSALARHLGKGDVRLVRGKTAPWSLSPRNREQTFAVDALLDDSVSLVTLAGKAGTGKTLLAIAAGLQLVSEQKYSRLTVSRPVIPMGKDLGFLPGTVEEKLGPWMQPIRDSLEFLVKDSRDHGRKNPRGGTGPKTPVDQRLADAGIDVDVSALTYIRGRSIPRQYIVIDEAQNLTPFEAKTILTRAGQDSKVVLTGDPYQIDSPFMDAASNGLSFVADRFRGEAVAAHVTLVKGERSTLAEISANIL